MLEAAAQGHMIARAQCGFMYDFAEGVAKDERLAVVYYEKAAQQRHIVSQYNLGYCYRDGVGCEENYERATQWFGISFFEHFARDF